MKDFRALLGTLLIAVAIPLGASTNAIMIEQPSGELLELGIDFEDRFIDVLNRIQSYFHPDSSLLEQPEESVLLNSFYSIAVPSWSLGVSSQGFVARSKTWRNYNVPASKSEKDDIAFIVKTLAFDSLFGIAKKRSALKKAGERVDHLHPFRFLMTIFMDEELKAGAAAIRTQISWVKDGFYDGVIGSMTEEYARKNVMAHVSDFAKNVKIKEKLLEPAFEKQDWKELVNILIDNIPREVDPNRYNM